MWFPGSFGVMIGRGLYLSRSLFTSSPSGHFSWCLVPSIILRCPWPISIPFVLFVTVFVCLVPFVCHLISPLLLFHPSYDTVGPPPRFYMPQWSPLLIILGSSLLSS